MKLKHLLYLLVLALLCGPSVTLAQKKWGSGIDFTQRATNREKSRWSLTDWMAMKDKNRMMDMWLSVHSPSPFEFMAGASYLSYDYKPSENGAPHLYSSYLGQATAHAQFVGVTVEYQNNVVEEFSELGGMFNVRILGNSLQNTGLTLHIGQKSRRTSGEDNLVQSFGQASLQIYLTKYFGVDGSYRQYLATSNQSLGDVAETLTEFGLFIDFKAIRIFGSWFEEAQSTHAMGAADPEKAQRIGLKSGLKFYF